MFTNCLQILHMATFNYSIGYKRSDNTYNVRIRVTHKRKIQYIPTQWYVEKKDLTPKLRLKSQFFIDSVEDLLRKYRAICNELGAQLEFVDVEQLIDIIKYKSAESFQSNFIEELRKDSKRLIEQGRRGSGLLRATVANSLVRFTAKEELPINSITSNFLQKYMSFLQNETSQRGSAKSNENSPNVTKRKTSLYLAIIRKVLNDLKRVHNDDDFGIVNIRVNPFSKIRVPKDEVTEKRSLTIEQMQMIVSLPYKEGEKYHRFNIAKDVFLLSFMLMGMNSVDLYYCEDLKDGILSYNRKKTASRRTDKAHIKVRLEKEVQMLIEKYRNKDKSKKQVFDFYARYSGSIPFNAALNKGLKEVGEIIGVENLQFYAARHSWATIALNDARIDKYTVHEALNHVDEKMKVTDIYIKKDFSILWEANRRVLSMFDFMALQ